MQNASIGNEGGGYASGGYTSLDQPRMAPIGGNNVHAIRADERVARLYELVNFAPKLQLRVFTQNIDDD